MNENSENFLEEFACSCGGSFERTIASSYTCNRCGEACSVSGRALRDPDYPESHSLKELSRAFLDQPVDFAQLEAKGWPGPYVEFSQADIQFWDTLSAIERDLFAKADDDERHPEGS